MKTFKEHMALNEAARGAISAGEAKVKEAVKMSNYILPLIKKGSPLEKELTRLSDEAREIGHADLKEAVDSLRKVLSPTFMALSKFVKQ